jgi:regulator of replication initiation timing
MPLKCYTRQRNDGSNYVSCEKGEKPKKAPVKKPVPVHTLAKPRRIGAVARPKAIKRPGAQHKGTGGARMGAVYKKPAPKKQTAVSKKTEQWEFRNVNTPLDITKSAKIKKLIKDFIGENNTLKMPNKEQQHITKKAILNVSDYTDDEIVKKYKKLPKNIKDNLTLVFYDYGKELHTKYSHLKVSPGADGRPFYRYYNP